MKRKYKKYVRLTKEKIDLIINLYREKMELRKIARAMNVTLSTVQYHIKKNYQNIKKIIKSLQNI